jgi:cytochrome o ubiquinol oxidase subunit 3
MTTLAATDDTLVAPTATTPRGAVTASLKATPEFYVLDEHPHPAGYSTMLGFWIYIMSDCLLFSVLFATYGVLGGNYAAGPSPKDLFDLPLVAVNTTMLLLSSITYGFAMLAMQDNRAGRTQMWLAVTAFFGLCFIGIELYEFADFIRQGATPQRSAFLSSFFTLVGTH